MVKPCTAYSLAILVVLTCAGCTTVSDVSRHPAVQETGLIGKRYRTVTPVSLEKGPWFTTYAVPDIWRRDGDDEPVGSLPEGAVVEVVGVKIVSHPLTTYDLYPVVRVVEGKHRGRTLLFRGFVDQEASVLRNDTVSRAVPSSAAPEVLGPALAPEAIGAPTAGELVALLDREEFDVRFYAAHALAREAGQHPGDVVAAVARRLPAERDPDVLLRLLAVVTQENPPPVYGLMKLVANPERRGGGSILQFHRNIEAGVRIALDDVKHDSKFFRGPEQADEITDRAWLLATGGELGMQALRDLASGHEHAEVRRIASEVLSFVDAG